MNFEIIKKVIDKWDPIDLLDHAPPDEYDIESWEILLKFQNKEHFFEVGAWLFFWGGSFVLKFMKL